MLILGHRGAVCPTCPENTLASVDRALRLGADGVEIDVQLTADGVPVCHHDADLRRGSGDPRPVSSVRFCDLPPVAGHPIPALAEVLDLVGDRGRLIVEIKATHGREQIAAVLRSHRLEEVVVSSFHRMAVTGVRREGVAVRTALLGRPLLPLSLLLRRARADGHDEVHPHVSSLMARTHLVRTASGQGIAVVAWTVNEGFQLGALDAAGVSASICDEPDAARALLTAHRLAGTG